MTGRFCQKYNSKFTRFGLFKQKCWNAKGITIFYETISGFRTQKDQYIVVTKKITCKRC